MYKQLIQTYLSIVTKLIDNFGEGDINNISKYVKVRYSTLSERNGYTVLNDLRLIKTKAMLEENKLPDEIIMYRLALVAECNDF